MVSKKDIRDLDFTTIEEYYDYIDLSIINGQRTQARNLISDMSLKQKVHACEYCEEMGYVEAKQLIVDSM